MSLFGQQAAADRVTNTDDRPEDTAIPANPTLAAAGLILIYAVVIGFTDNFVREIAVNAGLWQFHATRTVMALAVLGMAGVVLGVRLRPVDPRAVALRSAVHGAAMVIYFGALAFLPVAIVAAGVFTAPIFVLLIERLVYRAPLGPVRVLACAMGFVGVGMVLGPQALQGASLAALVPVVAGALYGLGNVATRRWCGAEGAATLTAGFFAALGVAGLVGMAILTVWPVPVPEGAAGFVLRGPVVPTPAFWIWTAVQAVGSLLAVGLMIRAYQIADAGRVAVMEYVCLPAAALWAWVLWGEVLTPLAMAGMVLITVAGAIIALRARVQDG